MSSPSVPPGPRRWRPHSHLRAFTFLITLDAALWGNVMNYLRLFGSPKKNIIIGLVMFLSVIPLNFLVNVVLFQYDDALEAFSLLVPAALLGRTDNSRRRNSDAGQREGLVGRSGQAVRAGWPGRRGCADQSEGKGRKVNEKLQQWCWAYWGPS